MANLYFNKYENIYLQLITMTHRNALTQHIFVLFSLSKISVQILPWQEKNENGIDLDVGLYIIIIKEEVLNDPHINNIATALVNYINQQTCPKCHCL